MKNFFYLILILIIIGLGYLKYRGSHETVVAPPPSISPASLPSPSPIWPALTSDLFTLNYPPEATASEQPDSPDARNWTINYLGDAQKPTGSTQTELSDGYIINITVFESLGGESARIQAETDHQNTVGCSSEDDTTPITTTFIADLPALSFRGGCLGINTHYYLSSTSHVVRLSLMTSGSSLTLPKYEQTTNRVISSLRLKQ